MREGGKRDENDDTILMIVRERRSRQIADIRITWQDITPFLSSSGSDDSSFSCLGRMSQTVLRKGTTYIVSLMSSHPR